jgi:hypothetical protein
MVWRDTGALARAPARAVAERRPHGEDEVEEDGVSHRAWIWLNGAKYRYVPDEHRELSSGKAVLSKSRSAVGDKLRLWM